MVEPTPEGLRVHLRHALECYVAALNGGDYGERALAGEYLDSVLESVVQAEVRRRLGPGPLRRAWSWAARQLRILLDCTP